MSKILLVYTSIVLCIGKKGTKNKTFSVKSFNIK